MSKQELKEALKESKEKWERAFEEFNSLCSRYYSRHQTLSQRFWTPCALCLYHQVEAGELNCEECIANDQWICDERLNTPYHTTSKVFEHYQNMEYPQARFYIWKIIQWLEEKIEEIENGEIPDRYIREN